MATAQALREVERLARELVDGLDDVKLEGECDGQLKCSVPCDCEIHVTEKCPKCGESIDVEVQCENAIDVDEPCEATVRLDPDPDTQEKMRCLRLALVQLDLARARDEKPACKHGDFYGDREYGTTFCGRCHAQVEPEIKVGAALGEGARRILAKEIIEAVKAPK